MNNTNSINKTLDMYERIDKLEEENEQLKEKVSDCIAFIRILDDWFSDVDNNNNDGDMGTY